MPRALVLDTQDGELRAEVREVDSGDLPHGDVLVEVLYSSLNYKDGLAVTGSAKIIRGEYPFVPGIDLVGRVLESESDDFAPGDLVIQTGWWLGEVQWGGYAEQMRVQSDHLVPLPDDLSPQEAMTIGTAGFTAMLSVIALEDHGVAPDGDGEVVVTGASGGAGSIAVALLAARGYEPVASTGSEEARDYLQDLGAAHIVDRSVFSEGPDRPMESGRWKGAIDAVGGKTLATLIAQMERHGSIASFGNAGGHELKTTVLPFILRGVNLLGIDSNTCPNDRRRRAWEQLAETLSTDHFDRITQRVIGLDELPAASQDIVSGNVQGRVVVDVNA